MNELQQTATDALSRNVGTATAATVSTGVGTAFEIIPPLLGCSASVIGIYVTVYLFLQKRKIYKLQIKALVGKVNHEN